MKQARAEHHGENRQVTRPVGRPRGTAGAKSRAAIATRHNADKTAAATCSAGVGWPNRSPSIHQKYHYRKAGESHARRVDVPPMAGARLVKGVGFVGQSAKVQVATEEA